MAPSRNHARPASPTGKWALSFAEQKPAVPTNSTGVGLILNFFIGTMAVNGMTPQYHLSLRLSLFPVMRRLQPFLTPMLLMVAVTCLWLTVSAHWDPATWSSSGGHVSGDILEVAARVQIAAEQFPRLQNTYGMIDRLGTPVGADWSSYPTPDRITFTLAGLLSHKLGIFGAINFLMLFAHLLGAASFYICACHLRWHPAWASTGALLFSFATFNQQWSGTLSLSWTFILPPTVLLLQWVASRSSSPRASTVRRWSWLAAGTGLWLGGSNPYFVFVVVQLLVFALILQWFRHKSNARLRVGAIFLFALLTAFAITHATSLLATFTSKGVGPLERNYSGSELYALKPIELLLPPPSHRNETLSALGRDYSKYTLYHSTEPPSSYLGIVGLSGLLVLVSALLKHIVAPRWKHIPVPDAALGILWILLLSCVGGVNSLLSFLGLNLFRASNRFSIFIFLWCLFAAIAWARRRTISFSRGWIYFFSGGLAAIGLLDLIPRGLSQNDHHASAIQLATDRAAASRITQIAGDSASVFQLPTVPFPEAGSVREFPDYEHFRLFLAGPKLKLSYGGLRGSLSERWSHWAASLPIHALIPELEQRGFSLLMIDQRAYDTKFISQLTAELQADGLTALPLPEMPHLIAFRLQPSATSTSPDPDDPRYYPQWTEASPPSWPALLSIHARQGWFDLERNDHHTWRWAGHQAEIGIWNNTAVAHVVMLSGHARSIMQGVLTIKFNGASLWHTKLNSDAVDLGTIRFTAPPGPSKLELHFEGRLVRPPGDKRTLGFQIEDLASIIAD